MTVTGGEGGKASSAIPSRDQLDHADVLIRAVARAMHRAL